MTHPMHLITITLSVYEFVFDISDNSEKWLGAYNDQVASLYTFTQCLTLSDIQADGDWKLIVADLGTGSYAMKLKVYKSEHLNNKMVCLSV